MDNIPCMTKVFKNWSANVFGSVIAMKKRCLERLEGIQKKLMINYDNGLIKHQKKVRD